MLILFLKALFATVLIEEAAALLWTRSVRLATVVLFVNILTNPVINLIVWYAPEHIQTNSMVIYTFEGGVWIIETVLFFYLGKFQPWLKAFLFSLSLNAASYFSGDLLTEIGYWDW